MKSAAQERLAGQSAESKGRILVVDDEDLVRMIIRAILVQKGYRVVEAEDGMDAVGKVARGEEAFDLILIDLNMPRLNGYEALQQIRRIDPGLRAIMLSGGVEERDVIGARSLGGVGFLQKPFENEELLQMVRESLRSGRLGAPG